MDKEQRQQERAQRQKECAERIAAVLQEYDCDLAAISQIVDGRIVAIVQIKAK